MWWTVLGVLILCGFIYLVLKMRRKSELDWLTSAKHEATDVEDDGGGTTNPNLRTRRRK